MMLPRSKRGRCGDELALALLVLVEDVLALRLADTLQDDLLGGLGGDAAEPLPGAVQLEELTVLGVLLLGFDLVLLVVEDLEQELVARVGLETEALGVGEQDLFPLVAGGERLDDDDDLEQIDAADLLVELASISRCMPKARLAAVRIACSRVSTSTVRSMFLSLETWSRTRPRAAPSFMRHSDYWMRRPSKGPSKGPRAPPRWTSWAWRRLGWIQAALHRTSELPIPIGDEVRAHDVVDGELVRRPSQAISTRPSLAAWMVPEKLRRPRPRLEPHACALPHEPRKSRSRRRGRSSPGELTSNKYVCEILSATSSAADTSRLTRSQSSTPMSVWSTVWSFV